MSAYLTLAEAVMCVEPDCEAVFVPAADPGAGCPRCGSRSWVYLSACMGSGQTAEQRREARKQLAPADRPDYSRILRAGREVTF
jgi:hypothetical protein